MQNRCWDDVEEIIIFGYGRQGKKAIESLHKDFKIKLIIDNNPLQVGMDEHNIPVAKFSEIDVEEYRGYLILVATMERYYHEISKQLVGVGLKENVEFVSYKKFVMEWYYSKKHKIYLTKTDLPITSLCSLKCEKCHIFIPYWKKRENYNVQQIKETVSNYFKYVDFVFDMDILGGEPLLHPNLDEILTYIGENYREKIGYLGLITNGSLIIQDSTLEILKKYDICVSISDYEIGEKYNRTISELCNKLEMNKVKFVRNSSITWFDFGMPNDKPQYDGEAAIEHMRKCNSIWHTILNNCFYLCGTAMAAEKSGLFPKSDYGFVDLSGKYSEKKREAIWRMANLEVKNSYLDFCRICGGFGCDNCKQVPTAKQIK